MIAIRKKRIGWICLLLVVIAMVVSLVLYALRQNIDLFYTPTQIMNNEVPQGQSYRVGGMVLADSIVHSANNLSVRFVLNDFESELTVYYKGVLPALFREGQGVVVYGSVNPDKSFNATQVLAKHDENYMPPEVKAAMSRGQKKT